MAAIDHSEGIELERACAFLLGPEFCGQPGWLGSLDAPLLKRAFRHRVFAVHPDRASSLGIPAGELQKQFVKLQQCYQRLVEFLARPPAVPPREAPFREKPKATATAKTAAPKPPPTHQPKAGVFDAGVFFAGQAPSRHLKFGEFLYYNSYISQQELFDAVRWQRRQRPRIGEIALSFGFLDHASVNHLLELRQGSRKLHEPLAEFARNQGYLSHFQWLAVMGRQRRLQKPIGQFWIQAGLFSAKEVAELVADQHRHNWYFSQT